VHDAVDPSYHALRSPPVATHGNGCSFRGFRVREILPPVAPAGLHRRPVLLRARGWGTSKLWKRSASWALIAPASALHIDLEYPRLVGKHDGLDAVAEVELLEDVRDVRLDRRFADVELFCDLPVR
jgi:hypothetical protein